MPNLGEERFGERLQGALCGWFLGGAVAASLGGHLDSLFLQIFTGVIVLVSLYGIIKPALDKEGGK